MLNNSEASHTLGLKDSSLRKAFALNDDLKVHFFATFAPLREKFP